MERAHFRFDLAQYGSAEQEPNRGARLQLSNVTRERRDYESIDQLTRPAGATGSRHARLPRPASLQPDPDDPAAHRSRGVGGMAFQPPARLFGKSAAPAALPGSAWLQSRSTRRLRRAAA